MDLFTTWIYLLQTILMIVANDINADRKKVQG